MWILLIATLLANATPPDASATQLDGTTITGTIDAWSPDELALATSDGTRRIPVADLLSVRFSPQPPGGDHFDPAVTTIGGSVLPIKDFVVEDGTAVATLAESRSLGARELRIALPLVREVQLQPLEPAVAEEWREIGQLATASDVLVVVKRGGKSLDYLEGTVSSILSDAIEFTMDGQRVDVPRSRIAGLVFYRPASAPAESPPCVLVGSRRLRLVASSVRLDQGQLHVATTDGVELAWPLDEIHAADFSAGKIRYLSEMEPASLEWQPLIGLPAAATAIADVGKPRFDRSAIGGPLTLWFPDEPLAEASGHAQSFDRGIAIRSRTQLVYRLPQGFSRFVAVAGIEPETRVSGSVLLTILGDDRPLMETVIAGNDPPHSIELDVAGVRRLIVVVDYGDNLDTGDWLNLCNARIVK